MWDELILAAEAFTSDWAHGQATQEGYERLRRAIVQARALDEIVGLDVRDDDRGFQKDSS